MARVFIPFLQKCNDDTSSYDTLHHTTTDATLNLWVLGSGIPRAASTHSIIESMKINTGAYHSCASTTTSWILWLLYIIRLLKVSPVLFWYAANIRSSLIICGRILCLQCGFLTDSLSDCFDYWWCLFQVDDNFLTYHQQRL